MEFAFLRKSSWKYRHLFINCKFVREEFNILFSDSNLWAFKFYRVDWISTEKQNIYSRNFTYHCKRVLLYHVMWNQRNNIVFLNEKTKSNTIVNATISTISDLPYFIKSISVLDKILKGLLVRHVSWLILVQHGNLHLRIGQW